jgi:hypothetical protein
MGNDVETLKGWLQAAAAVDLDDRKADVPKGYKKLATGVLCRCPKLYRDFGDAYCCQGEWGGRPSIRRPRQ